MHRAPSLAPALYATAAELLDQQPVQVLGPEGRAISIPRGEAERLAAAGKLGRAASVDEARAELGLAPAFRLTEES
jgi:hypothetical protein